MSDGSDIGKRVLEVREKLGLSQKEAAEKLGVSIRSWQGMERGENIPNGETLLKFLALGYNPGWVLTGMGQQRSDRTDEYLKADHIKPLQINESVLNNLVVLTHEEHTALNIKLRPADEFREATRLYNELLRLADDPDDEAELEAAIPVIRIRLRKRLADAVANPGTGKRLA
ncbi:helix-turn-helix domain-containing protein [Ochrobactrum teleogrylli]|uniref:Helix-turn-helix domain-containing protein n=1 Tax=Ochrobactrum teleogrylli TaxID=2479765 RepID=A0ABY2Y987_9HYPH|nr:helix-turn-helix domain-containing protein [[Ochrobactrum] teleogrylli]TNV17771.1 helix-turn-helix domain-containing protein [[Ochrobactrum] teleogrylli]